MSNKWEPMDTAPQDRPILVAGGCYFYRGHRPSIYSAGLLQRSVHWDGHGWKHATIGDRYEMPDWWIDPLPPVPQQKPEQ